MRAPYDAGRVTGFIKVEKMTTILINTIAAVIWVIVIFIMMVAGTLVGDRPTFGLAFIMGLLLAILAFTLQVIA